MENRTGSKKVKYFEFLQRIWNCNWYNSYAAKSCGFIFLPNMLLFYPDLPLPQGVPWRLKGVFGRKIKDVSKTRQVHALI